MSLSCDPGDLQLAAKAFKGLSPQQNKWVQTYLLALIAGGSMDPKTLADAAKVFKGVEDGMITRIMAYLLCQISSGGSGSTQDMEIAWTPTNLKLGELMSFVSDISFGGGDPSIPGITTLTFNQVTMAGAIDIEAASSLTTISAPNLTTMTGESIESLAVQGNPVLTSINLPVLASTPNSLIAISSNPLLTTVNIPLYIPTPGLSTNCRTNAFNAATVNMFLARFIASPTWGTAGEFLHLDGGTNAAPSGQGIVDKGILIVRGATVNTN